MVWRTKRPSQGHQQDRCPKGEHNRGALAGVVILAALVLGPVFSGCASTDAYLGDVPKDSILTPSGDASVDGDVSTADGGMCIATECPEGLTTCPSDFGPTYKCSVDLRRDQNHCGSCGHECITMEPNHMGSRCVDGACLLECVSPPRYVPIIDDYVPTNFQNCNNLLDDGCEVDLFSDSENCGACGKACPAGKACVDGQCGCPPDHEFCNGWCTDITQDDLHCGGCNQPCQDPDPSCTTMPENAAWGCSGKACEKLKCGFGFADCDSDLALGCASNGCETPIIDPANCGACGVTCKADEECSLTDSGIHCVPTCAKQNKTACDGFCADTLNDPNSCGGCLLQCPVPGPQQTGSCKKGVCELACAEGFGDCNGNPADGCETDLRVHPQHCGACGVSCDLGAGQPCVEGKCLVKPCEGEETR